MDKNVSSKNAPTWQYDIVRGLMCFFIFNCHFLAMFNFPKQSSMVLQYLKASLSNAHLGVIYFFLLSGTVLSLSFLRKKVSIKSIPLFLLKRFLRLLPPIFFSLLVTYILMCCHLIYVDNLGQAVSLNSWAKTLFCFTPSDLSPLKDVFDTYILGHSGYNPNLWIVRYEFLVPILLLFTYKFIKYRITSYSILVVTAVVMGGYIFMEIEKMLLISYVLMFFLGLIVAYRVTVDRPSSQKIKWMMSSAMILWSISVIFNESVNRLIDMILSSLLLLVMYHKAFAGIKILAKFPFVNTLGKISYEFFVYHLCVIASFSCWIFLQLYSECGYYIVLLITYICTVIIVFALSWVSYYLTSKYYNSILKKLV